MKTTHKFDQDTALQPVGENRFRASLSPDWWIIKGPNGGYLSAIILRAMTMALNDAERAPRSLSVHFLRAPEEGEAEVVTGVERSGRSLSTLSARMIQNGRATTIAIGTFGKPVLDYEFQDVRSPEVGAPESYGTRENESLVPLSHRLEIRPAIGGTFSQKIDRALVGGWYRLNGERRPDALLLALLADAWYPPVFARETGAAFAGAVPTVDLTIYFRSAMPLPSSRPDDYYLARFESTTARQGYIEETGEIWSSDGTLLVQSRQLALLL